MKKITRGIIKITGSDINPPALTKEEIGGIIEQGHRDDALDKHESTLVHGALNFDDMAVRSVMTPRTKMFALDSQMSLDDAADIIDKSGHSRIPIYGKNLDDIVGILHVRDILKHLIEPDFQKRKN